MYACVQMQGICVLSTEAFQTHMYIGIQTCGTPYAHTVQGKNFRNTEAAHLKYDDRDMKNTQCHAMETTPSVYTLYGSAMTLPISSWKVCRADCWITFVLPGKYSHTMHSYI